MAFSFELKLTISPERYGAISAGPKQEHEIRHKQINAKHNAAPKKRFKLFILCIYKLFKLSHGFIETITSSLPNMSSP